MDTFLTVHMKNKTKLLTKQTQTVLIFKKVFTWEKNVH